MYNHTAATKSLQKFYSNALQRKKHHRRLNSITIFLGKHPGLFNNNNIPATNNYYFLTIQFRIVLKIILLLIPFGQASFISSLNGFGEVSTACCISL
jgi:hypothetical protein